MDGSITKAIFCQHWVWGQVLSHPKICLFLLHLPVKLRHQESLWQYLSFMRRFSVSYQVGVSGVHQRNISSISVPVLGLKPLSKCTKVYTSLAATCLVACTPLVWRSFRESIRVRPVKFIRPKQRFGFVNGRICTVCVYEGKISPVLQ